MKHPVAIQIAGHQSVEKIPTIRLRTESSERWEISSGWEHWRFATLDGQWERQHELSLRKLFSKTSNTVRNAARK